MASGKRTVPKDFYAVVGAVYKQLGGRVKRKVKRNPTDAEYEALVRWSSDFHGRMPAQVTAAPGERKQMPAIVAQLGSLQAVEYGLTLPSGERVTARHEFGKRKPLLTVDADGVQLWIVGGNYKVTERGIEG